MKEKERVFMQLYFLSHNMTCFFPPICLLYPCFKRGFELLLLNTK